MTRTTRYFAVITGAFILAIAPVAMDAQVVTGPKKLFPNLKSNIERPLRYTPDGQDFVIENGGEFFNRPLYGSNTAFRVDAGDMPEFALYLPGRGGNLRFGIRTVSGKAKWLHETASITARYRPGEMLYEIRDPLLGNNAVLHVRAIALHQTDGLIVRVDADNLLPSESIELLATYGGANGQRGRRDGDIGTEAVPIGEYFQLSPEACRDNRYEIDAARARFTMRSVATNATLTGQFPAAAKLAVADAFAYGNGTGCQPVGLESSAPILISATPLGANTSLYFCIQRINDQDAGRATASDLAEYQNVTTHDRLDAKPASVAIPLAPPFTSDELPQIFDDTAQHFATLRNQIAVDTPDPFINASVAALNVATDATWDEQLGAVMHGAIAWRTRLLGWRGPYSMDALGWHDRARRHLAYWATRQNTGQIPDKLPPPDEDANLARSETALHSNGDMSNSHYDMNTVYIDALFRHILWTGDLDFAKQVWPVIERHLAWEYRLFRREFGPEKLPLYESYAQIWASDDLQYNGGGTTHGTAYVYYHNKQAARLAHALGGTDKATAYEKEAALIARAAEKYLWLPEQGMFAEYRDLLGNQLAHPSAALWSFYHAMDCGLFTPEQARSAVRYANTHYHAIPVRGPGVPEDEDYQVLPTTDWMPYSWSINNVVMGENIHTAHAFWKADRPEYAFRLTKSALLASMFMGICPGNVGTLNYLDVYRRESQRDFSDGGGVTARAIVEGLFGIQPDALAKTLTITPGWPAKWTHAALRHPTVSVSFECAADTDTYIVTQNFSTPQTLRLQLLPRGGVPDVTINGNPAPAPRCIDTLTGVRLEIEIPDSIAATRAEITINWPVTKGDPRAFVAYPAWSTDRSVSDKKAKPIAEPFDWHKSLPKKTKFTNVPLAPYFNDSVTQIFKNEYRSPRSPHVSLAMPIQGIGAWAGHVHATAEIDDIGLRALAAKNNNLIRMPNGVTFATPGDKTAHNILYTAIWNNYPTQAVIPIEGRARHAYFLMAGSTYWMQSRIDNAELIVTYADGTTARLALRNPDTWWPIDQDLFYDDYQFHCATPPLARIDLKTGNIRIHDKETVKGTGRRIPGGAATVLHLPLDPDKELRSLTLRTLANEVVTGLMSVTLERPN
ncbi:hypothetical protein M2103_000557 [Ereboglobus sp. PH5-5]|uniref:DUF4450 domain-containing protein n=1 Tax=Ereboglobus sp. PH5-5 TaxID=2940529 RepID=UPI0024071856|nr:DUF4450 domain-containing protein [Ereboglobus sp. PH5-5]MDF9832347.1 hypothetical protein [Ereboglobus sp. PH5-5]